MRRGVDYDVNDAIGTERASGLHGYRRTVRHASGTRSAEGDLEFVFGVGLEVKYFQGAVTRNLMSFCGTFVDSQIILIHLKTALINFNCRQVSITQSFKSNNRQFYCQENLFVHFTMFCMHSSNITKFMFEQIFREPSSNQSFVRHEKVFDKEK